MTNVEEGILKIIYAEDVEVRFPKSQEASKFEFPSVLSKIKFRRRLACSDSVLLGHKTVVGQLLYLCTNLHGSV